MFLWIPNKFAGYSLLSHDPQLPRDSPLEGDGTTESHHGETPALAEASLAHRQGVATCRRENSAAPLVSTDINVIY
jgi:hypothetical protein